MKRLPKTLLKQLDNSMNTETRLTGEIYIQLLF